MFYNLSNILGTELKDYPSIGAALAYSEKTFLKKLVDRLKADHVELRRHHIPKDQFTNVTEITLLPPTAFGIG